MSKLTPGDIAQFDPAHVGRKDAFHVPAILAQPVENIGKGSHVQFTDHTMESIRCCDEVDAHGIIDPFILRGVTPADMVWVFVNPNILKDGSLTHSFELAFTPPPIVATLAEDTYDECAGCYGIDDDDDDDEDPYDSCRGCY